MIWLLLWVWAAAGEGGAASPPDPPAPPPEGDVQGDAPRAASSWSTQLDHKLHVRYHQVEERLPGFEDRPIHDYVEEVARVNFLASRGGFTLGLQLDQVGFLSNRYYLDGELYRSHQLLDPSTRAPFTDAFINLEKVWALQRLGSSEIQIGDGYVVFGRGIALSLVRNVDIDQDTSLRGAKGVIRQGDWEVTLVSGLTNPQQVMMENRNLGISPDVRHMVTGARVERWALGPLNLGAHAVGYGFSRTMEPYQPLLETYAGGLDVVVGGADLDATILGVDLTVEGNVFHYLAEDFVPGGPLEPGKAIYGSLATYQGPFAILLEGKRYVDTEHVNAYVGSSGYEVATPPTLEYERVITEDSAAAVNSNDIGGGRLRVDWSVKPGAVMPYVAIGVFRDQEIGPLHFNQSPETIVHPLLGLQLLGAGPKVLLNAGHRQDMRDDDSGADRLWHADLDLQVPAGPLGDVELGITYMNFQWGQNPYQQRDFSEWMNSLTLHHGARWMLVLYQDWSDNPLIGSTGNLGENLYGAAEVAWRHSSVLHASLFYGAYKAGIRCAGGQCRTLPGFQGLRARVGGTF